MKAFMKKILKGLKFRTVIPPNKKGKTKRMKILLLKKFNILVLKNLFSIFFILK